MLSSLILCDVADSDGWTIVSVKYAFFFFFIFFLPETVNLNSVMS